MLLSSMENFGLENRMLEEVQGYMESFTERLPHQCKLMQNPKYRIIIYDATPSPRVLLKAEHQSLPMGNVPFAVIAKVGTTENTPIP